MTLLDPVAIPKAKDLGRVHFIAIGGAGMSGVARGFLERGFSVSGSDHQDSDILDDLRRSGATIWVGHDSSHVHGADTVVVSTAITEDNVELVEARHRGLTILHRSVALSVLMSGTQVIAVAGTHGKTTTTSMVVSGLLGAREDPSFVIGGTPLATGVGSHMGDSHFFVVEADESDGSFRQYPTSIAVVTSLEPDHIDNWGTEENYVQGFVDFTRGASVQCVILCLDDPGARSLVPYLQDSDVTILTYGTHPGADLRLHDIDASVGSARITTPTSQHLLQLNVPGIHNLLNASAALAVGHYLRVDESGFVDGLSAFRGTARRFQDVGARYEVRIIDDYAHHPTEVEATIAVGRLQPVAGRLIVCFQPHLYSRTKEFAQEFAMALSKADVAVVLDVYPAREEPIEGVTGELIADMLRALGAEVHYVEALADAPQALGALVRPGDLVITMGAGSVTSVGPQLMEVLGEL